MLSPDDEVVVGSGISSCDHDYFVLAGLAGEPYLRHRHLCYFDGTSVEVVGFPLRPAEPDAELQSRMQLVVDEWVQDPAVRYITYFGPVPLEKPEPGGWICHYAENPVPWNLEVVIDLTRPVLPDSRLRYDVRRAERHGIEVTAVRREYLGHEHIRLMTALEARTDMSAADASALTNLATVVRAHETVVFEARRNGELCGFVVAHGYFALAAMVVGAAFDRQCRGASDATYAAVVTYFRDAGFPRISFGYATDENLFRYKTKWGTPLVGRPFFQRIWASSPAEEDLECLYWQWRLLRENWRRCSFRAGSAGAAREVEALRE